MDIDSRVTKFSDIEYKRPDITRLEKDFTDKLERMKNAQSAHEQFEILKEINVLRNEFETMKTVARIRFTIDTQDPFYNKEQEHFDNISPVYDGFRFRLYEVLLCSEFRSDLEKLTGKELFNIAAKYLKTFSFEITDDLRKENLLVNQYMKLIASAKINFEGEERNLAGIVPFTQSGNRDVRKRSSEAKWKFFENNEKEFDRIYDELVRLRTGMAHKLGYKNFVQLGYDRLGRTGYSSHEVSKFRDYVKEFMVPVNMMLNEIKKEMTGLDKLYYYDSGFIFKGGNPVPKGSAEWIKEKSRKMYEELSDETGVFINRMIDGEYMDLSNKKGKAAGGYCAFIPDFGKPFMFLNMNGTSDDVKVFTHEAGHAFQGYESRKFDVIEYVHPTLEACEIHSMSMEYITWPWMNLFFEEDTDKFLYLHLTRALRFIPYGVTVDEFQHWVYENPEATPEDRKRQWSIIEKKYNPDIDFEDNEFLKNGGYWFMQGHVFKRPFYYIDYCLAQVCSLQFWEKSNHDRDVAWKDYLNLCKAGGSLPFLDLVKLANLRSPFEREAVKSVVDYSMNWINSVNKEFEFND